MSEYTFSTNPGFATSENIILLEAEIDSQITDNTRESTQIVGDTIALTFSSPLSDVSVPILHNIFITLDKPHVKGEKIITLYPMINVKTSVYQIIARFPFRTGWLITNIEINGYMDSTLNHYIVQIYDPVNDNVIAEKQLSNTSSETSDLGDINNLPTIDTELEVNVKINSSQGITNKSSYIESLVIFYN